MFQQYHGLDELIELSQRLQGEAQQAQAEGNQQRLMELQQEMQEGQLRVIMQFQSDVELAVPMVAQEQNLKIVAVEIAYLAPEYGTPQDISEELAEKINDEAERREHSEEPAELPEQ